MKEQKRINELEKSVKAIFRKAEAREKAGRDPMEAGWQANLEIMLLLLEKNLQEQPGELLPVQIANDIEFDFYDQALRMIDLPPDTHAALYTPSAYKEMPFPKSRQLKAQGNTPWQRNAYTVIISDSKDHRIILQASLPGIEHAGIDVFEDGVHFANYNYYTVEECLNELSGVIWNFFKPKIIWTRKQIEQYTEIWFAKSLYVDIDVALLHQAYSYVHHPELLGVSRLDAVLQITGKIVPLEYDSLDDLLEVANDMQEIFDEGEISITREEVLKDDEAACKALMVCIAVDIDQFFEKLDSLDGDLMPDRRSENYLQGFYDTAQLIYEKIVGRPWPDALSISDAINGDDYMDDGEV